MPPTTIFGQLVVGPPGSGKSTYCKYISENLIELGRNAKIINLDPANFILPYKPAIDVSEFTSVQNLMETTNLGPNGAMIRCIETLCENHLWLFDKIVDLVQDETNKAKKMAESNPEAQDKSYIPYLLIDCPGQSELFTSNTSIRQLIKRLTARNNHLDLRLVCVNLCDSYHASDLGKYINVIINSLSTMLNLELPHINILSKVDIIERHGTTRFNLDYYCEVLDLNYLLETELEQPFFERYKKLTKAIASVIESHGLVSFIPLDITKAEDIFVVLQQADKANGYILDDLDLSILQATPQVREMASGRRIGPLEDATAPSQI